MMKTYVLKIGPNSPLCGPTPLGRLNRLSLLDEPTGTMDTGYIFRV